MSLVVFATTPSGLLLAADTTIDATNDTTGADSTNSTTVEHNESATLNVTNTGTVNNVIDLSLDSGGNTVSSNTEVGDVTVGSISAELDIPTTINDDPLPEFPSSDDESSVLMNFVNTKTGANSTNTNTSTLTNDRSTTITNTGTVTNTFQLDANTGCNTFANNTKLGDITIGGIDVVITGKTNVNSPTPQPNQPGGPPITPTPGVVPTPITPGSGSSTPPTRVLGVSSTAPTTTTATLALATPPEVTAAPTRVLGVSDQFFAAGGTTLTLPTVLIFLIASIGIAAGWEPLARRLKDTVQPDMRSLAF